MQFVGWGQVREDLRSAKQQNGQAPGSPTKAAGSNPLPTIGSATGRSRPPTPSKVQPVKAAVLPMGDVLTIKGIFSNACIPLGYCYMPNGFRCIPVALEHVACHAGGSFLTLDPSSLVKVIKEKAFPEQLSIRLSVTELILVVNIKLRRYHRLTLIEFGRTSTMW